MPSTQRGWQVFVLPAPGFDWERGYFGHQPSPVPHRRPGVLPVFAVYVTMHPSHTDPRLTTLLLAYHSHMQTEDQTITYTAASKVCIQISALLYLRQVLCIPRCYDVTSQHVPENCITKFEAGALKFSCQGVIAASAKLKVCKGVPVTFCRQ